MTNQTVTDADAPLTETRRPFGTEDWWAVAIGLLAIVVAYGLFASGNSIKWPTASSGSQLRLPNGRA